MRNEINIKSLLDAVTTDEKIMFWNSFCALKRKTELTLSEFVKKNIKKNGTYIGIKTSVNELNVLTPINNNL